jgi:hypothetical protein
MIDRLLFEVINAQPLSISKRQDDLQSLLYMEKELDYIQDNHG